MRAALVALVVVIVIVGAAACTSRRTVGQPSLSVVDAVVPVRRKVDLLFVLDDSPGASPKLAALVPRFPSLLARIQNLAAIGRPGSFHIGVVDSDLGAGPGTTSCRPGGDGGLLRGAPSPSATNAPAACAALALPAGFIDYDSATATSNSGSLDVATAFACIAAVGEKGCAFTAPLEALALALRPSVNPGFLRSDALLVVVLLAGADDCSAPPDTTLFDPSPAGVAQWGVLHPFRCTQWGIACDGAALTGGALPPTSHCAPVAGGPLFDVARYQALLAPGGVKSASDDLVVATLVAPPAPLSVRVTMPCADDSAAPSCPILDHACVAPTEPALFADPAVRIGAVTAAVPNAIAGPVCDADDTPTLDAVGDAIAARMGGACLPGAVVDLADPGCTVFVGGVETPRCDSQGRRPCWNVVDDASCSVHLTPAGNPQTLRLSLQGAPAGAAIDAHCPLYEPGA